MKLRQIKETHNRSTERTRQTKANRSVGSSKYDISLREPEGQEDEIDERRKGAVNNEGG